MTGEYFGVLA